MARAIEIPTKSAGDFALPVYGLGTWGLGGTFEADRRGDERSVLAIRNAIAHGVRHIDTAEMYGDGHAEELVGRAIQGVAREELVIASKALAHHLAYDELLAAAERSIRRMGCDYLDLYMIHHPSDAIPIEETMRGMDALVRRGLVRAIGVCNFTKERLVEAQRHTENKIVANQVHYSLAVREAERTGLLEHCIRENVLLVAWRPIDRGAYESMSSPSLRRLAERTGRTPVQLALAWVTSQPGVVAISKTSSNGHLHENLEAVRTPLTEDEIELLRSGFEHPIERSSVYSLR